VAVAGLALALSTCGSPDGSSESDHDAEIREVVTQTLTTNDPRQCTTVVTGRFLAQTLGKKGRNAIDDCEFQAKLSKSVFAEELTFSNLKVDGRTAEATVDVSGGAENGSTVRIELAQVGDRWKLDRFAKFEIDRPQWDKGLYETSLDEGTTSREARCIVTQMRHTYTTTELERDAIRTDFKDVPDPTVICLGRRTLVRLFEDAFAEVTSKDRAGVPPPVFDCISSRFTERLSLSQIRAYLSVGDDERAFDSLSENAVRACAREYRAGVLGDRPRI
jgi:hypothetical protein